MLRTLDDANGLWVIDSPLSVGPIELGARTTIMRLADGGLLLVSPVKMDDAMRAQVSALGPVRALAAPNLYHHLFIGQASRTWSDAKVFVPPGLPAKLEKAKRELRVDAVLDGQQTPEVLRGSVEFVRVEGAKVLEEVAFFHPASRTLVLTDLVFNVRHARNWLTGLFFRVYGAWNRFGNTASTKLMIRDRKAARASVDRILAWDFDRVIMAHGEVLETGGKQAMQDAFAWLKG